MTIKIEFPADLAGAAEAFGNALLDIANTVPRAPVDVAPLLPSDGTPDLDADTDRIDAPDSLFGGGGDIDPSSFESEKTHTVTLSGRTDVDHNQVPFDAKYCGKAAEPFYASGKRAGQWKKRKGVSQEDYDSWYADQLNSDDEQETPDVPVSTASAFGAPAEEAKKMGLVLSDSTPTDAGSFMGWVAAQQAAGLLTQQQIGEAYVAAGIGAMDIFPPNPEDVVAQHIAKLYAFLADKVSA